MNLSKREYRNKQNQATGILFIAGIALIILCFKVYVIFIERVEGIWDIYLWAVTFVVSMIIW